MAEWKYEGIAYTYEDTPGPGGLRIVSTDHQWSPYALFINTDFGSLPSGSELLANELRGGGVVRLSRAANPNDYLVFDTSYWAEESTETTLKLLVRGDAAVQWSADNPFSVNDQLRVELLSQGRLSGNGRVGQWTPTLTGGGTWAPIYGARTGHYIRIGDLVWVHCTVETTGTTGVANSMLGIAGLPFSPRDAGVADTAGGGVVDYNRLPLASDSSFVVRVLRTGRMALVITKGGAGGQWFSAANWPATGRVMITATYMTDDPW